MKNTAHIITRTVWLLSLVSLFNDIASEMLYPVMPVYLKSIGFTIAGIGLLEGLAEAVAGLTKGYFGQKSDALGKRMPFVQFGYSLTALSRLLLALFTSVSVVFTSRLLDRIGKGVRTAARDAMLSAEAGPFNKATVFGFHRAMDTVGAVAGPVLALVFLWLWPGNYLGVIWMAFIPVLISVVFTLLVKEKSFTPLPVSRTGFFSFLKYWKKATPAFRKTTILFLLFAVVNSSDVFLLLLLKQKGFSDTQMIGFYIFYNFVYALAAYPAGRLADSAGSKKVLVMGFVFFAVVYSSIAFVSNTLMIGTLFLIYGLYAACFESTSKACLAKYCIKEETATAFGLYSALSSLALLVASAWTGMVWQYANYVTAFVISSTVAFMVALFFMWPSKLNVNLKRYDVE